MVYLIVKKVKKKEINPWVIIEQQECTKKFVELNKKWEWYIWEYKVEVNKWNMKMYVPNSDVNEYFYKINNRNWNCSIMEK